MYLWLLSKAKIIHVEVEWRLQISLKCECEIEWFVSFEGLRCTVGTIMKTNMRIKRCNKV